jgi:hypothetical protein
LAIGQRLRVELQAGSSDVWSDITAESALHRHRFQVADDRTTASFTALSPTTGQHVSATTDMACFHAQPACAAPTRQWQVTVVVEDRPDAGPTSSPEQCRAVPRPSPSPDIVFVEEGQDGQTVRVRRGQQVEVVFYGCKNGGADYQPARSDGPLFRESAFAANPGPADSWFRAVSVGTTTVTATVDAPCLHQPNGCAVAARVWQVTVDVVEEACHLSGPGSVVVGSTAGLSGQVAAGAAVQVWFKAYGAAGYVVRRQLTAGSDGVFTTTFVPVVDHRWYATTDSGCTTAAGLTLVTPTVSGPRYVSRGATVPVLVRGFAGQAVALYARRPGGEYRLARTGRLDAGGTFRTSFIADVDHRYYALTGPNHRTSPAALTQIR